MIKDTFHSNDNRFLLYYDARWDCRLFLNYATVTSDFELDQKNIAKHLQMELKVSQDNLEGAFAFEKVHEKYSVSAKENRCYRHRFYQFLIKEFNEEIEQDSFAIQEHRRSNHLWEESSMSKEILLDVYCRNGTG